MPTSTSKNASQRGRSNRRRGRDFERAVKRHLEDQGYFVALVSGSHGPCDLAALRRGEMPKLIEVKLGGYMLPIEREAITHAAKAAGAVAMMAHRPARGRIVISEVKV